MTGDRFRQLVDPGPSSRVPANSDLLAYIAEHAIDDDYARAAARRYESGQESPRRVGVAGAIAIAVFAILIAIAAVQNSQGSAGQDRERRSLISQLKEQKAALDAQREAAAELKSQTEGLRSTLADTSSSAAAVLSELRVVELRSGTSAVRGPGVEVVIDDAKNPTNERNKVLDSDLQQLVNGLWRAGAEAISINGERLTALSAIRNAGGAITVNFTRLSPPYRIVAIGNAKTLPANFAASTSGSTWLDVQRHFGLRFTMRTRDGLVLPAAQMPAVILAHATPSRRENVP